MKSQGPNLARWNEALRNRGKATCICFPVTFQEKVELAELAYNATAMDGDSKDRNTLLMLILSTPEGTLLLPESIAT